MFAESTKNDNIIRFFVKFVVCITLFVVIVQSELLHLYLCACIFLIVIIEIIANFHNIHTIKKIRKEKHVNPLQLQYYN